MNVIFFGKNNLIYVPEPHTIYLLVKSVLVFFLAISILNTVWVLFVMETNWRLYYCTWQSNPYHFQGITHIIIQKYPPPTLFQAGKPGWLTSCGQIHVLVRAGKWSKVQFWRLHKNIRDQNERKYNIEDYTKHSRPIWQRTDPQRTKQSISTI